MIISPYLKTVKLSATIVRGVVTTGARDGTKKKERHRMNYKPDWISLPEALIEKRNIKRILR